LWQKAQDVLREKAKELRKMKRERESLMVIGLENDFTRFEQNNRPEFWSV